MSSLESLADPDWRPRRGPVCTMKALLESVDDDTADLIRAAMTNPYAPSTMIARAITERGHRVSAHVVQRHRRGECRCEA